MEILKREIQTRNDKIAYTYLKTNSKKVCFMFQGRGYHYNFPLFYYSRMVVLEHQYDVVQIHYDYKSQKGDLSYEQFTAIMMDDIQPVLDEVLETGKYNEIVFLGKSLGTIPIAGDIMYREQFQQSKMILLTPLIKQENLFSSLLNSNHEGLIVIGDQDPHYDSIRIEQLTENTRFQVEVILGGDHSLDVEKNNTMESLKSLITVIEKIKQQLQP